MEWQAGGKSNSAPSLDPRSDSISVDCYSDWGSRAGAPWGKDVNGDDDGEGGSMLLNWSSPE